MGGNARIDSRSVEQSKEFAEKVASSLEPGAILCFHGELGAGKTTCIQAIVEKLTGERCVPSPTFVYLHTYEGELPVYHFDLYRLAGADEFLSLGFEEFLFAQGVCCIEWSSRIEEILPPRCVHIHLEHAGEGRRTIEVRG